jgi:hypothetical protein
VASDLSHTVIPVTGSRKVRRVLIVEARDLDTDDRRSEEFEVDAPTDEAGQREQLAAIVASVHPDAQMRSFGSGAASFLDGHYLVVAHYGARLEAVSRATESAESRGDQQSLFAA